MSQNIAQLGGGELIKLGTVDSLLECIGIELINFIEPLIIGGSCYITGPSYYFYGPAYFFLASSYR
jgi:hypothetical protein